MEMLQNGLNVIVEAAILIFECAGAGVILAAGIRGIADYTRKNPRMRLNLARGRLR